MFVYNWREMAAWIAIFSVALAIVIVGVKNSGEEGTLRIAIGPKDSFSEQAAVNVKQLLERRSGYKVTLINGDNSIAGQRLLLDKKADLALVAPAALPEGQPWVAVAPVASLYAHLLVDAKAANNSLYSFKAGEIGMSETNSDVYNLGQSILDALAIAPKRELTLSDNQPVVKGPASLITDHFSSPRWSELLANGSYKILPLREVSAVTVKQPLWVSATIPAYVYSNPAAQIPTEQITTAATPLLLAALPDLSPETVASVVAILNSSEGRALTSQYNESATDEVWQRLPKHAAIGGDALPVAEVFRQEVAWWMQHKTLVILVLLAVSLVIYQTLNLRRSRAAAQQQYVTQEIASLLAQLLSLEQRARAEQDLRSLNQLFDDVNNLKLRGSKMILGSELVHDPLFNAFHVQCNHVAELVEKRLHGKRNVVSAA